LISIVSAKHPGSTVKLGIIRAGKQIKLDVGITDRSKLYANLNNAGSDDSAGPDTPDVGQSKLGITVQPTNDATAKRLHISGGVMITAIKAGTFADTVGLFQGGVVVEINRKPVTDIGSYRAIVSGLKSGDDVVFVVRNPQQPNAGNSYIGGTLP
jgi:serine protease Do